jgi:hypothetical protein
MLLYTATVTQLNSTDRNAMSTASVDEVLYIVRNGAC